MALILTALRLRCVTVSNEFLSTRINALGIERSSFDDNAAVTKILCKQNDLWYVAALCHDFVTL